MSSSVFTPKAEDYALYRPQYSCEAFKTLYDITGLNSSWNVADIGSGTGNVSKHLINKVNMVFAVEPNEAMRHQAELLLGKHSSFISISATAEKTTLQDKSIDLITVGQAIQWFDWPAAQKEFCRILKADGWMALLWNQYETTPEMNIIPLFHAGSLSRRSYPVIFEEGWSAYIGGIRSSSRNPSPGEKGYEEFKEKLRKRFDSQAVEGRISVKYTTELAIGHLNR